MILDLTSAQRRALRARAHALNPVVMVGDAGLTTPVLNEIHQNLASHELIKIRVMTDEHIGYRDMKRFFAAHGTTSHGKG